MVADSVELRARLQAALDRRMPASRSISRIERRRSPYESSFRLEELIVEFSDGCSMAVIFKDVGLMSLSRPALAARSALQHDPRRELRTYERLLCQRGLGPRLLGVVEEPSEDRYWLFIEKVDGVELYQVGELSVWQEVAAWLARMHAKFSGPEADDASVPLVTYGRSLFEQHLRDARESSDPEVRRLADSLRPGFDALLEELDGWPSTLVHGDFYASNVIVCSHPGHARIVPIDWELAGRGPGLLDLAALISGDWTASERDAIARAYYDALTRILPAPPPRTRFKTALDCCRLLLALRWLATLEGWRPPEAHAHDWLAEAVEIAGSLKSDNENLEREIHSPSGSPP